MLEIATRFFESLAMTRKRDSLSLRGAQRRSNLSFFNSPVGGNSLCPRHLSLVYQFVDFIEMQLEMPWEIDNRRFSGSLPSA